MLGAAKIMAFAATANAAKSRAFYEGVLGLKFIKELFRFLCGYFSAHIGVWIVARFA
jgi:catechol 2,3-dioxygenase-like lactoylglutathione lyase family enzyme